MRTRGPSAPVDSLNEKECRCRVSRVVQADRPNAGGLEQVLPVLDVLSGVHEPTELRRKYQVEGLVRSASLLRNFVVAVSAPFCRLPGIRVPRRLDEAVQLIALHPHGPADTDHP